MSITLPIPMPAAGNVGSSIYKLIQLSEIVSESNEYEIELDFSPLRFIHCPYIIGIFAFMRQWESEGRRVTVTGIGDDISGYLNTVCFPNGYILYECDDLDYFRTKTYIPIVTFSTIGSSRDTCISTILNVLNNYTNLSKHHFKGAIDYFISELTNNVADHSEEKFGIVFLQTFPSKGYMDIVIADNGIGVFRSYSKTDKFSPENEVEALEMAVNGYSTKDIPESRGFGITGSRNLLVNGIGGSFWLWSGSNIFVHTTKVQDVVKLKATSNFSGCFVVLRIPLQTKGIDNLYDYIG